MLTFVLTSVSFSVFTDYTKRAHGMSSEWSYKNQISSNRGKWKENEILFDLAGNSSYSSSSKPSKNDRKVGWNPREIRLSSSSPSSGYQGSTVH